VWGSAEQLALVAETGGHWEGSGNTGEVGWGLLEGCWECGLWVTGSSRAEEGMGDTGSTGLGGTWEGTGRLMGALGVLGKQ